MGSGIAQVSAQAGWDVVLRDVTDAMEAQGTLAKNIGATGLATASYFLRESIQVYSNELRRFVADYIAAEYDDDSA